MITKNDGMRVGLFFGASSGVITTCGLQVGLAAGTASLAAVLGGILVIAVADSMSDALGIHLAEESNPNNTTRHIWTATLATFVSKLLISSSFALPFVFFSMQKAMFLALLWGGVILTVLSWKLAKMQKISVITTIAEHLTIAIVVITLSYYVGVWVGKTFT